MAKSLAALLCLLLFLDSYGQEDPSIFDQLYHEGEIIEAKLVTDMSLLVKQKYEEKYQDGTITLYMPNGDSATYEVELRSRGNIRKEICFYPPMRIKFSKKDFDYHKLKWVNTCRDSDLYESLVLKEYLAYRLFNVISDKSFRVQLVRVNYVHPEKENKNMQRYAFIIENKDAFAQRLGGKVYEPRVLKSWLLNPEYCHLFAVFQYMIGNTDWAFGNMHNIEIVTDTITQSLLSVPYDFDYSGLVNAPYAAPHETVPIDHVTIRHNKSYCIESTLCEDVRQHFLERKAELLEMCNTLEPISAKERKSIVRYLEKFFEVCENRKTFERIFAKNCIDPPERS